jgi:quinol monooxygenase YgiN
MELVIFARFHARDGQEAAVEAAVREVTSITCELEPGCLAIAPYRSLRNPKLFFIHSRWVDETAFDLHATLPHTVRFLERVQRLIDHPLDVNRTTVLVQVAAG